MIFSGYRYVTDRAHPNASAKGRVLEHVLVASRTLGRALPDGCEVHHVNGIRSDNRPTNLVVCQDRKFHRLLHSRERALRASGHADWTLCVRCGLYGPPESMRHHPTKTHSEHPECSRERQWRARIKRNGGVAKNSSKHRPSNRTGPTVPEKGTY